MATSDTSRLIRAAMHGLACVYKPGFSYKKAGVICLDLHPASAVQSTLFHQPDDPGRVELMRLMDKLNQRYGRGKVAFAATGTRRAWALRSDHLSARFTTNWTELLRV
nr:MULTISPECIES: DUF4113 domain-containing protein [unclassified Aureimonas]